MPPERPESKHSVNSGIALGFISKPESNQEKTLDKPKLTKRYSAK